MATAPIRGEGGDTGRIPDVAKESTDRLAGSIFEAESRALAEEPLRRPSATYRIQIHGGFRLDDVTRIVDYLHGLGISDCYLSPYLEARPGSTHGYDVFDHSRMSSEIGDDSAHERLLARLRALGMGRVIDIVPNHMGVAGANRSWLAMLETGPQALSARFFDVDWDPVRGELHGRVLLPLLEDLYGKVLEAGLITLERDGGSLWIYYRDHRLPLHPRSYGLVLGRHEPEFRGPFEGDDDDVAEFLSIRDSARHLPMRDELEPEKIEELRREKEVIKRRLARLCAASSRIRKSLDADVASYRGNVGDPASFDALHGLLEEQVYRLACWRVASEEINYRRFFDVTELAGLRTEDPHVFDAAHALIFRWVVEGGVTGLRVDHPDGLADPLGYFRKLQEELFLQACRRRLESAGRGDDWSRVVDPIRTRYQTALAQAPDSPLARRFPVVAEKILSRGELLPADWPIDGTVGYEFLNALNGVFIDRAGSATIEETYRTFTGDDLSIAEVLHKSKVLVERELLASELTMLSRLLYRVAEKDRRTRDFTLNDLARALREVIACFGVYRTYIQPGDPASEADRVEIERAVGRARRRKPSIDESVFRLIRDVLSLEFPERLESGARELWKRLAIRFQQTTGPVQAKGLEDTTFYRHVPLVSMNEVGGDPSRFGNPPSTFHALNLHRLSQWPAGLSTTATHDTKRGEDARIRIDALSEFSDEWRGCLDRWSQENAGEKRDVRKTQAPDPVEEYFFYQTLIGSWPFEAMDGTIPEGYTTRVQSTMVKAAREAKRNTTWTDSDPSYADALRHFVAGVLEGPGARSFLDDFFPFVRKIARIGAVHSLAQAVLKLASPGVADIYQGSELWDFNLVDPDNRRPVDYGRRAGFLDLIRDRLGAGSSRAELARELFADFENGAIKLYVLWTGLTHRKGNQELYFKGDYRSVSVRGEHRRHVVALSRRWSGQSVLAVVPRLVSRMMGPEASRAPLGLETWNDTRLVLPRSTRPDRWRDLMTDRVIEARTHEGRYVLDVGLIFRDLPLAMLVGCHGERGDGGEFRG